MAGDRRKRVSLHLLQDGLEVRPEALCSGLHRRSDWHAVQCSPAVACRGACGRCAPVWCWHPRPGRPRLYGQTLEQTSWRGAAAHFRVAHGNATHEGTALRIRSPEDVDPLCSTGLPWCRAVVVKGVRIIVCCRVKQGKPCGGGRRGHPWLSRCRDHCRHAATHPRLCCQPDKYMSAPQYSMRMQQATGYLSTEYARISRVGASRCQIIEICRLCTQLLQPV